MAPDTQLPVTGTAGRLGRCPLCAGAVRPDAPWCTQCWTDLRPAPAPVPPPTEPTAAAQDGASGTDARPAPVDSASSSWPCTGCGADNALERDACVACGTGFLAGLRRDEPPLLVLPGVGDLTLLSRAQRLGLAGAVVLAVALVVALLGLLTG